MRKAPSPPVTAGWTEAARIRRGSGRRAAHAKLSAPDPLPPATGPRLAISFRFNGVDEATRQAFMRYFDLYTQRGGG